MRTSESEERSGWGFTQTLLFIGAVGVVAWPFVKRYLRQSESQQQAAKTQATTDTTLKDTFPASDAPASQYFDIPVNRRT
jgi:hypothetical protein